MFAFEEALSDVPLVALCVLADAPGVLGGANEMEESRSARRARRKLHI